MAFLRHHIDLHKLDESQANTQILIGSETPKRNRFFSTKTRELDTKTSKEEKKQLENVGEAEEDDSTVNHSAQESTTWTKWTSGILISVEFY